MSSLRLLEIFGFNFRAIRNTFQKTSGDEGNEAEADDERDEAGRGRHG